MLKRLSPDCTTYSLKGLAVPDGTGLAVPPADGVNAVEDCVPGVSIAEAGGVVSGVRAATVGDGEPPEAVGVGADRPTTTGAAPLVSPGGRRIKTTATAVPTSIAMSAPR
jgi:hypothetical protein